MRAPTIIALATVSVATLASAQPLTSFDHHVLAARVRAQPEELFAPTNIPASILVDFVTADGRQHPDGRRLARGLHVEAVLRGPAFPAYRLLGIPGEPLGLPPIPLEGEYQIDDIRVVDTASGELRAVASPSRIPVTVFRDVLVTQVVSRPLSLDEIEARGVVIDGDSFTVLEFEATFELAGRPFPVKFPVVTPKYKDVDELLPAAEREARLVEARRINDQLRESFSLPPELRVPGLDLFVQPINFEPVDEEGEGESQRRRDATIPGLLVIPGRVGFLNQFLAVQVYTANAAPLRSSVSVHSLTAEIVLPPGRDQAPDTEDDPLRIARVGEEATSEATQPIVGIGTDGRPATLDDVGRLQPGQTGFAEFVVEGLREGLHVFDIRLRGKIDGISAREVDVEGLASGAVLVRNPRFSVVFAHPQTVRALEPYRASITVMNASEQTANLVSVALNRASIAGAELAEGQAEHVVLGSLGPGESRTAEFQLVARTTGTVRVARFTSDDGLSGRFDFTMGVDERGVELSPDVIQYPEWVRYLPQALRSASDRVLGQALAASTAAQLPPGVRAPDVTAVRARVIELAEAGQRLAFGDAPERVYLDLLLDWHGGRSQSLGFDQILRETTAGADWRAELMDALASVSDDTGLPWILSRAADVAGRSEPWGFAAAEVPGVSVSLEAASGLALDGVVELTETGYYRGLGGAVVAVRDPSTRGDLEITFRAPAGTSAEPVAWFSIGAAGSGSRAQWTVSGQPTQDVCYRYYPLTAPSVVTLDVGCVRASSGQIAATITAIAELAPEVIAVQQDLSVLIGRPNYHCDGPLFQHFDEPMTYQSFGTLAAVLFSKPMSLDQLDRDGALTLDDGTRTTGVSLQPGGRVALANFRAGFWTEEARSVEIAAFVTDARDNGLADRTHPIQMRASEGVSVAGRVFGVDGAPVANIPVTLTMHDTTVECSPVDVRLTQVMTSTDGRFRFDYVMAGVPYSVSATDIRGLSPAAAALLREAAPTGEFDPAEIAHLAAGAPEIWEAAAWLGDQLGAVFAAQNVDRAVYRDHIPLDSPRLGSEVPIALRFRGRASVSGRVVAADGVTPVAGAAVNLFPDIGSRERGRGVFSAVDGSFVFAGVPLGELSVRADATDGRSRAVAARADRVGESVELLVVLSSQSAPRGTVAGTVYDDDGTTPHARAEVVVTDPWFGILARATTDAWGEYEIPEVPTTAAYVFGVSSDGRRASMRALSLTQGSTAIARIVLPGLGVVVGRVEYANAQPAVGALVAGGEALVTTDEQGEFTLTGVPSGAGRVIAAGLAAASEDDFTRLGQATVDVLPGLTSYVVVRLSSAGRIRGQVRDATGASVPAVRVAIPLQTGFFWVDADVNGRFAFSPLGLGAYSITAPAPPLRSEGLGASVSAAQLAIERGARDELEAAMGEILPRLSTVRSDGPPREPPGKLGGTRATLLIDGTTVVADIVYLTEGTISGRVENHLGDPIPAGVELSALSLDAKGELRVLSVATTAADPVTGAFEFSGVEVGPFTLVARSSFYQTAARAQGMTTAGTPDVSGLVLAFGENSASQGGRLRGRVLRDGHAVGAGVAVQIDGPGHEISTIADGTFDTQVDLTIGTHRIRAIDPTTGRIGHADAVIRAGQESFIVVSLLSRSGGLDVSVVDEYGDPAPGLDVRVQRLGAPSEEHTEATSSLGLAAFSAMTRGRYVANVCRTIAQTRLCAAGAIDVPGAGRAALPLRLEPVATIRGRYVESDAVTPVAYAQVSISRERGEELALAVTDELGEFEFEGIPLGFARIRGTNAVTGRAASTRVHAAFPAQIVDALLIEYDLGRVIGGVISASGVGFVPAATVTLEPADPFFGPRTVTTDPAGQFEIPGVPPGALLLSARSEVLGHTGFAEAEMPSQASTLSVDVPLARRGELRVQVRGPTGAAEVATVSVDALESDTDGQGRVTFVDQLTGSYVVGAASLAQPRSHGSTTMQLAAEEPVASATITLSGVASVEGLVLSSLGAPVEDAEVVLEQDGYSDVGFLTPSSGEFTFDGLALGATRVRARLGGLGASAVVTLPSHGSVATATLTLVASGDIVGRLVRADGTTPLPFTEVTIEYPAPPGVQGAFRARTSSLAEFAFAAIPQGPYTIRASVPRYDGVVLRYGSLSTATLDLGDVRLDEEAPMIVETLPEDGAAEIATDAVIAITFSEPMDPTFDDVRAVFLADGDGDHVEATLSWETVAGDTIRLVLDPDEELASESQYAVVVIAAAQPGVGEFIGPGPVDLNGRPMAAPYVFRFTTVDGVPPSVETFTPLHLAEQVHPSAVVRLTFDEPIVRASADVELHDITTSAQLSVTLATGLDGHLLVATPGVFLSPNRTYEARLIAVTDRAGNSALGLPLVHRFATLDTLGPTVSDLSVVGGISVVANAALSFRAHVSPSEPGLQVQGTRDLMNYFLSTPGSDVFPLTMGPAGTDYVRARAIDRFGNFGPWYDEAFSVAPNSPPAVELSKTTPASGPLLTGQAYGLRVLATDDSRVARVRGWVTGSFTRDSELNGTGTLNLNGTVSAALGPGASVTLHGEAEDNSGVVTTATAVVFAIADGVAPALQLTGPTTAPMPGDTIEVRVIADDVFGVEEVTISASGAVTYSDGEEYPATPTHTDDTFEIEIPTNASSSAPFTVAVTARDAAGNVGEDELELSVADFAPPSVTSLAPADGATGVSLLAQITVSFDEPVEGVDEASFYVLDGGIPIDAAVTALSASSYLLTPAAPLAPLTGHEIVLTSAIEDLAGNSLAALSTEFSTEDRDLVSPRLLRVRPADTSTGAGVPLVIRLEFDEPIARESVVALDLELVPALGGAALPTRVDFDDDDRTVLFVATPPGAALMTEYVATVGGLPTDLAGNEALDLAGLAWSSVVSEFRTGGVQSQVLVGRFVSDTERVVEGHGARARLIADEHLRLEAGSWWLDAEGLGDASGSEPEIVLPIPMLAGSSPETLTLASVAVLVGSGAHELAPLTVTVEPRGGDYDSDGMNNGDEAAAGLDPWTDDASLDYDEDELDNAAELELGTDPHDADSDDDGIDDGDDLDPLSGNRAPGLGLSPPADQVASIALDDGSSLTLPSGADPEDALTIEAWFFQGTAAATAILDASAGPVALALDGDGHLLLAIRLQGASPITFTSTAVAEASEWHHFAASYDGARARACSSMAVA